jgi:hypothetical protein
VIVLKTLNFACEKFQAFCHSTCFRANSLRLWRSSPIAVFRDKCVLWFYDRTKAHRRKMVQCERLRKQDEGCGVSGVLAGARERVSAVKSIYDQEIVSQVKGDNERNLSSCDPI